VFLTAAIPSLVGIFKQFSVVHAHEWEDILKWIIFKFYIRVWTG
jgi:hypothetical protein